MNSPTHKSDIKLLKNLNLLYVEDDALVASQTLILLKHLCRKVFYCVNAEEALKLLKLETIHLLITDIELPGMSGLELCETIRKENSDIPIFITSIHSHSETLREAIKLNLVDYLIKPVTIQHLTQALQESLHRLEKNGTFMVQINDKVRYFPILWKLQAAENEILLTYSEIALLNLLIQHKNQTVSYDTIEYALDSNEPMSESAFKNLIYRLRKKIGKENIISVSGVGIKLKITD